jgi:hypothetical protein
MPSRFNSNVETTRPAARDHSTYDIEYNSHRRDHSYRDPDEALLYYFVIKILNTIQWGSSPQSSTVFKTAGFTLKLFIFVHLFSANLLQKATFKTKKTNNCYII